MAARKQSSAASKSGDRTGPKRLNQLLASAGYGSRRHVEELIREGRVSIDGTVVEKLGVSVDPKQQTVRVDDTILRQQRLVYYAVHKPTGVVTTNADPRGRPRVIDLVPPSERVFPVGRLDLSSEGLILLTNDGDLAQKLAHPKFAIEKIYRVTVAGKVDREAMQKMRQGIYIAEGFVRVDGARVLKAKTRVTEMEIRLREGKNREIRRILARLGHKVLTLRRIAIGPLRLGDMPPAAYRKLTSDEVRRLREATQRSESRMKSNASATAESSAPHSNGATRKKSNRSSAIAWKKSAPRHQVKKAKPKGSKSVGTKVGGTVGTIIGAESPSPKRSRGKKKSVTARRAASPRATTKRSKSRRKRSS
ncbi:MAG: pseudouridine synthase [Planctomycetota bacterium]